MTKAFYTWGSSIIEFWTILEPPPPIVTYLLYRSHKIIDPPKTVMSFTDDFLPVINLPKFFFGKNSWRKLTKKYLWHGERILPHSSFQKENFNLYSIGSHTFQNMEKIVLKSSFFNKEVYVLLTMINWLYPPLGWCYLTLDHNK